MQKLFSSYRLIIIFSVGILWIKNIGAVQSEESYQITVHEAASVFTGTTLFADKTDQKYQKIVEIDMKGRVLWRYDIPQNLFPFERTRQNGVSDVERLSNGNTLFNIQLVGIFEVDPNGKIVWKLDDERASHDVDRLPNGNTLYVRGWEDKGDLHVIEVDRAGKMVWSWDGMAHYDRKPYSRIDSQGWMHVNSVTRLVNNNTMISMRNFNTIAEVTPSGNVVNETYFPPRKMPLKKRLRLRVHPHDPEYQNNGNILAALTGVNKLLEIPAGGGRPVWKWEHPNGKRPVVSIRDANRLPNGNTLVVERDAITEITGQGKTVWQLRLRGASKKPTFLFKAQRISPDGRVFGR